MYMASSSTVHHPYHQNQSSSLLLNNNLDSEEDQYWFQRLLSNDLLEYQHRSLLSDDRDNAVEDERIAALGHALNSRVTHLRTLKLLLEKVWESEETSSSSSADDQQGNPSTRTDQHCAVTHGSIESHSGILEFIATSPSLRELHWSVYKATYSFTEAYGNAVLQNSRLVKFTWDAFAPSEHMPVLCHLLESTRTLEELAIGEYEWGQTATIWKEHLEQLCRALGSNNSLKKMLFHSVVFEHNNDNSDSVIDANNDADHNHREEDTILNDIDLSTWMKRAQRNQSVQQLVFEEDSTLDAISARKLFYVLEKVQRLHLYQFPKPIVNAFFGLQSSTSIRDLTCLMVNPYFGGGLENYQLLAQFLEQQTHLQSFRFEYSDESGGYVSPATQKREFLDCLFQGLRTRQNRGCSSFSSLRLDYGFLNLFTIEKLADLEGLDELELKFYYEAEIPPSVEELLLKPTCCVHKLYLDCDALGFRAMTDLQRWIRQNTTLTALSFPGAALRGALSIEKFCWGNSNIRELEVYGVSPELEHFLKEDFWCHLQKLTLIHDTSIDRGFLAALQENKSLEILSFANCPASHLELLVELLPTKPNWRELIVTGCVLWEDDEEDENFYGNERCNYHTNLSRTISSLSPGNESSLSSTKRLVLQNLQQNKSLFRFQCDLDEHGYRFQSELHYLCLRNKMLQIRALLPPDRARGFPLDILQKAAEFL